MFVMFSRVWRVDGVLCVFVSIQEWGGEISDVCNFIGFVSFGVVICSNKSKK